MKEIKLRIKSVESTMQITKAMELVASSKLRRAKERVEHSRPYFETLYTTLFDIAAAQDHFDSPYLAKRDTHRRLYIVIAGDRGLAGGYNANILKAVQSDADGQEYSVLPIGKKAVDNLLGDLIEKPPGKPALVPEDDPRPEYNSVENDFEILD